jgi:hypothetical protein
MVMSAPTVGAKVLSADGDELGTVKEVVGSAFKVDAAMHLDYWLCSDWVSSMTTSSVQLNVTKDHLEDAKVDPPANSGVQL